MDATLTHLICCAVCGCGFGPVLFNNRADRLCTFTTFVTNLVDVNHVGRLRVNHQIPRADKCVLAHHTHQFGGWNGSFCKK